MRKFLFVTFAILFVATAIFVTFDSFSALESMSELFHEQKGYAIVILLKYYAVRMMQLLLYTQTAFLAVITSITFFLLEKNSNMNVRGGEVIPLLTSGISRRRIAVPFFLIGVTLIFVAFAVEETFYTYCLNWPGAKTESFIEKVSLQDFDLKNDPATDLKIYGNNLNTAARTFENAKIGVPPSRTYNMMDELLASRAVWMEECDDHPTGYMLESVVNLKDKVWLPIAAHRAAKIPMLNVELPIFYTSETAAWVKPGDLFFVASLSPERLSTKKAGHLPQSIPSLYREINDPTVFETNASQRTALHIRMMRPFVESMLLFLLIPVILSARMRSKIAIFFCILLITGVCFGVVEVGRTLAVEESISPTLGAWLPFLVLVPIAAILTNELNT